jgi:hypothetical protein
MFDPNFPANNSPATAVGMRNQLNGLNEIIETALARLVPVGAVLMWHKDMSGTFPLTANFLECNGQPIADAESPYNGQSMPNYNGEGRFPRAGSTSGQTGGFDSFGTATAESFVGGTPLNVVSPDFSPGATPIPPHVTFVFIMRVK